MDAALIKFFSLTLKRIFKKMTNKIMHLPRYIRVTIPVISNLSNYDSYFGGIAGNILTILVDGPHPL